MFFGLSNYTIQKGITDLYGNDNNYNKIFLLRTSGTGEDGDEFDEQNKNKNPLEPPERNNSISKNLIINDDKSIDSESNKKKSNDIKYSKINDKIKVEQNDINLKDNKNLEKYMIEEDINKEFQKKEYIQKIKEIPFLIIPFIFADFHRKYKNKWFFYLFIIIFIIPIIIFVLIKIILIKSKIDIKEISENETILHKLSFDSIIPNYILNILYLLDNEIFVFVIQWINFLFYFKEIQIIRSFFNHIYWSFFVKSYFTFTLISSFFILFFLYVTETVIKLNILNIFLFGIMNTVIIIVLMIISYSCYELSFKKLFKFFLKGKEAFDFGEDDDDEAEEVEPLKDNCEEDED
jgi:hypothetical protein